MTDDRAFHTLETYLGSVPAVQSPFGHGYGYGYGYENDGAWWLKFRIDIEHPLAWQVVQELGHVLNYLSINERLPTVFKPVSPPPYMNGGPKEFLSWAIECSEKGLKPGTLAKWLEGRLPRPVNDLDQWCESE